jgi:hypothetical protein
MVVATIPPAAALRFGALLPRLGALGQSRAEALLHCTTAESN